MSDAASIKAEANKAFAAKDYPTAVKLYSDAIALDPDSHVLYSNRSAAKSGSKDYQGALEDAEKCIQLAPSFGKGHARKGAALHGLRQYPEAVMAYEAGLQAEPESDVCKKGLAGVKKVMDSDAESPFGGADSAFGNMFRDPGLMTKLENNPKTREFLKDPSFVAKIKMLQTSTRPTDVQGMLGDPRMLTVMGVAMGIDLEAFERPEGSKEMPPGYKSSPSEPTPSSASSSRPAPSPPSSAPSSAPKTAEPPKAPEPAEEEPMEVDDSHETKAEAEDLKAKGNAAYKARKFEEAIELYQKAWEIYPKDVTFLTNLSAVYFEQGEYQKCIETCEKAVEEGHDLRADYKTFAKAYGRIGSAHQKLGDLVNAIKFYQKSLTEHRTPDVLTKLREAEKAKLEADRQAYIDPVKAEAAREEGNTAFKAGDFAAAVKHYTEAIKRAPTDPRGYTNRAAAYTKLLALPEALKDSDEAIRNDPTFIKAYIRKALVQQGMKDNTKALETLQKAMDADVEKKHTRELETTMMKVMNELESERATETDEQTYQRAMRDPEVQEIMSDPVMRQILADSQQDPKALMDHMKNPLIAQKIQKLVTAGIIKTR